MPGLLEEPQDLSSWREFRAQLVNVELADRGPFCGRNPDATGSWCHRIADAETGCLLLANTPGMGFFERAVVLIVEHSSSRSLGLVLNRQAGVQIQDLAIEDSVAQVLGACPLRLGGPHLLSHLHLLHGDRRVTDATLLCPGLYTGGLQSALKLAAAGQCQVSDFCLAAGYTGWQDGQLQSEIRQGSWIPVSVDPKKVLEIACCGVGGPSAWHDLFSMVSEPDRVYIER